MIDSYFNDNAFTAVKRDAKFQTRYVKQKREPLSIVGILKGYLSRKKWYIKG